MADKAPTKVKEAMRAADDDVEDETADSSAVIDETTTERGTPRPKKPKSAPPVDESTTERTTPARSGAARKRKPARKPATPQQPAAKTTPTRKKPRKPTSPGGASAQPVRTPKRPTIPAETARTEPVTAPEPPRLPQFVSGPESEQSTPRSQATAPRHPATLSVPNPTAPDPATAKVVLAMRGLVKRFGDNTAVAGIDLDVRAGSFYGIVGPNGAGKTTTLSMVTGLLRPDAGSVVVNGVDMWKTPDEAKRTVGVLPDRLRLFDRLTGAQFLHYSGTLRGLDGETVRERADDLASAFGLEDALNRLVVDYSAGMTKKIALAAAMIHSPRLLVLDEPFESVDPVSAANVTEILQKYVAAGGSVVISSHGMDLIQRICDSVAIIVRGKVLSSGTVADVRGDGSLEDRFVELAGGRKAAEGMEWLHSFSD